MISLKYLLCLCLSFGVGCGSVETEGKPDPQKSACSGTAIGARCQRVLASDYAPRLLVRGASIYFARETSDAGTPILRLPLAGGEPVKLVDAERAVTLAADDTTLYWSRISVSGQNDGGVMSAPLGGGAAVELVAPLPSPQQVALDASNLYWTDYDLGTLNRRPKAGGQPVTLASGLHLIDPIVSGDHVYYIDWSTPSRVARVPTSGGAEETLATESNPAASGLAVHSSGVYWANSVDGTLNRLPPGGKREVLAKWTGSAVIKSVSVRVDDAAVYWAIDGDLRKLLHGSTSPELILHDDLLEEFEIDQTSLYWSRVQDKQIVSLGPR